MATSTERPQTNKTIDLNCIKINVNGLPNNSSNIRCSDNNETLDGFVYTCATDVSADGKSYEYLYATNNQAGIYADIIKGAPADDKHRAANAVRNAGDKKSEAIINAKNVWNSSDQFNGKATASGDFIYNEGYSSTLGNGQNDAATFKVESTDEQGIKKTEYVSFYDKNTAIYSDQLIAVRQLTESV